MVQVESDYLAKEKLKIIRLLDGQNGCLTQIFRSLDFKVKALIKKEKIGWAEKELRERKEISDFSKVVEAGPEIHRKRQKGLALPVLALNSIKKSSLDCSTKSTLHR